MTFYCPFGSGGIKDSDFITHDKAALLEHIRSAHPGVKVRSKAGA